MRRKISRAAALPAAAGHRVLELPDALVGLDRRRSVGRAAKVRAIEVQRLLGVPQLSLALAHVVEQRGILLHEVGLLELRVRLAVSVEIVVSGALAGMGPGRGEVTAP